MALALPVMEAFDTSGVVAGSPWGESPVAGVPWIDDVDDEHGPLASYRVRGTSGDF